MTVSGKYFDENLRNAENIFCDSNTLFLQARPRGSGGGADALVYRFWRLRVKIGVEEKSEKDRDQKEDLDGLNNAKGGVEVKEKKMVEIWSWG